MCQVHSDVVADVVDDVDLQHTNTLDFFKKKQSNL